MRFLALFFVILVSQVSCKSGEAEQKESSPDIDSAQVDTSIRDELSKVKGKGMLFGHQDDLAYGIDWKYQKGASDVKRVSGDYPALFGWELGGIERGDLNNLDSVPFDRMRNLAIHAHAMGGINTFSWHPFDPIQGNSSWTKNADVVRHILPGGSHHHKFQNQLDRLSDFLKSFKTHDEAQMPFIFRPWHEMDGGWFWWGSNQCTPEQFKELFAFTIDYLKNEKGLKDMLVAYSPDRNFNSESEYLTWYPGDAIVDILGMDNYYDLKQDGGEVEAIRKMHLVIGLAKKKNKFSAFTETGLENVTDPNWYDEKLGIVLADSLVKNEISYVMVWRSDPDVHYFFPYPGHPGEESARRLLSRPEILLLKNFNDLK